MGFRTGLFTNIDMELLQYEFIRNALITSVLASIACGVVGTYVIVKRLVFISGGISHSAFGGIGLGVFLGLNPVLTLVPFSLLCAIGIGWLSKRARISADTSIGIFWAFGMALGILFINLTPGYAPDLFSYLFGNILTVPRSDLILMVILDAVITGITFLFYKEFLAISFDEEYAQVAGLPVQFLYYLLLCLVALTIVLLIRMVGVVLVISLLTLPAATAKIFSKNLRVMMSLACVIGVSYTFLGLTLSYLLNIASGAAIILVSCALFFAASLIEQLLSLQAKGTQ